MAQSTIITAKDLGECGICLETNEDPKVLPCHHSFCFKCLTQCSERMGDTIRCPVCSQHHPIPPEGVKGFVMESVIKSLKQTDKVDKMYARSFRVPCSCCGESDSISEAYCPDCGEFICEECAGTRGRLLVFQDHTPIPYTDLQSGKADIERVVRQQCCKEHKEQVFKYFCKTCGVLVCHQCTRGNHPSFSHRLVDLKHSSEEQRSNIQKLMADCVRVKDSVESSLKRVDTVESNLEKALKKAKTDLYHVMDAVFEKVKEKGKEHEAELIQAVAGSKKQIEAQKESLQMQQARLQTAIQMATEVIQPGSDHDLALVFSSLKDHLNQLRNKKPGTVDENLGEVRFTANSSLLSPMPHLGALSIGSTSLGIRNKVSSESYVISSKSSLPGKQINGRIGTWKLFKEFGGRQRHVIHKGRHSALTPWGDLIIADCGGFTHGQVSVFSQSDEYDFKYTLDTKHSLKSGQRYRPWNVVVSLDGKIFVTHWVSYVNVYDINGAFRYRFPAKSPVTNVPSDKHDTQLWGLALDHQDRLLVGEMNKMYISKHRLDGSHISSIKVNIAPAYIAVSSAGKLIVSSGGWSSPSVQILDPKGNTLHTLHHPSGWSYWFPYGICCTAGDDIYVANREATCNGGGIYCYSTSGQYKRCITKEVSYPAGLALTDNDNKLVVVEDERVRIFSKQYVIY